jgi:hypothetical protein
MTKKELFTILSLALGSIALNCIYWAPELIYDDKIIYKYLGLVIYKGFVPYKDAFDNKPPIIFFFNALSWLTSYRFVWILDTLLILLATLLFYNLCRKRNIIWPWLLPVLFNLIIRNYLISYGNGTTREYTAAMLLLFFCVNYFVYSYKFIVMGILAALTLWTQQDAVFTLLPLAIYALFTDRSAEEKISKRLLFFIFGGLLVTIPILVYFIAHQSLYFLWHDTFIFNFIVPRQTVSLITEIKSIKRSLHDSEMEMAFYISLILGTAGFFWASKKKTLILIALLTLFTSFIAEFLTGRMQNGSGYMHYLLPLSAGIPILMFALFTNPELPFLREQHVQIIIMIIMCSVLFLGTLRTAINKLSGEYIEATPKMPALEFLDKQILTDYQLYVFDDTYYISLYNRYRILSPSRWNYHFYDHSPVNWDNDPQLLNEILLDLEKHRTRFVLDCSNIWNYQKDKKFYPKWKKFLNEHYTLMISDSLNRELWRIQ